MCFWQKKIKYFSVNGLNSNHSVLKYGVPQGSVLGFILLLMNIIIIIFVLMSVFHACMSWTVSYEKDFQSFLSLVMSLLTFFHIISDYLIPYFTWSFSGETTADLEGSTFRRPSTVFHSFWMVKPLQSSTLQTFLHAAEKWKSIYSKSIIYFHK